jgi:hypothetical protein
VWLTSTGAATSTITVKVHALGSQQSLMERCEVEALTVIFSGAHIAAAIHQLMLADLAGGCR